MSATRRRSSTPLPDRFWPKVDRGDPDDCWAWAGFIDKAGYGRIRSAGGRSGESAYAHRVSYELANGPIPDGLTIDHLCGNTWCVNPAHLEAVTNAENIRRASIVVQTGRCGRGHDQSVYGYQTPKGSRGCRECSRLHHAGLAELTEQQHQKTVLELAKTLGWRVCHFRPALTQRGWRTPVEGDGAGFPDLVLLRDRLVFVELKRQSGTLEPAQKEWLRALLAAGAEAYLARPRDLDALAAVLGSPRGRERPQARELEHATREAIAA